MDYVFHTNRVGAEARQSQEHSQGTGDIRLTSFEVL